MIGLDTSVLVRYLTADDPELAQAAAVLIEGDEPVVISSLVLLETVHVLRGTPYERASPDLADALVELLAHENVTLTGLDPDLAGAAIASVRDLSPRHIADALIGAAARDAGATRLVTNDAAFTSPFIDVVPLA